MAKRAAKRARGAKTTRTVPSMQPMLPSIVLGALAVGTEVGRVALRVAQGALRFAAQATTRAEPKIFGPARPSVSRDSRLPEAELNAIAGLRRRERTEPAARRLPNRRRYLGARHGPEAPWRVDGARPHKGCRPTPISIAFWCPGRPSRSGPRRSAHGCPRG